jgi:glycosyltransferase involved in cell wall biosynthesis
VKVSIAMATYNGAAFVRAQLDSFVCQTRPPDELVVTDDGSADDTLDIVERFAREAPFPVHVHRNSQRLNYSRNFERAISLCTGDIIFLSDQDDVWFPEKIEAVLAEFERNPNKQVVVNDQLLTDAKLRHSDVTKLGNLKRAGKSSDGMIEGCSTAFRRSWGERLFPMPEEVSPLIVSRDMSHDRWLNDLAILLGLRVVLDRPLQYFRRTGENTTDWLLSRPTAVRFTDLAQGRSPVAPVEAWTRRAQVLDVYQDYLTVHRRGLPGDADAALRRVAHERSSLKSRIELSGMPLPRRLAAVWRLWRSGGYGYFERWMSAANDLTRSAGR